MNSSWIHKLRRIILLAIILYIVLVSFIHYDNTQSEIENERIQIQDVLVQVQAIRHYISNDQKEEIYKLQNKGNISFDYFTSALLSSTYSANKINDYYNEIKRSKLLPTTDIKFASANARNPLNQANEEEKAILELFDNNKIDSFEKIKKTQKEDILYIALPTKRLEAKCMKCHSTPEAAPSDLLEKYGRKAGFGEKLGGLKALISIEKPLTQAYDRANQQTIKASFYILIATLIFIFFYYRFNKQLYDKNVELELLNKNLDIKVKERTEELNNSQAQLLNVINGSGLGYWDWNIKEEKFIVNKTWLSMIGENKNNFYNSTNEWLERIHPNDRRSVLPKIKKAFSQNKSFSLEYRMMHNNGKYIWIESVGGVVKRDKKNIPIQASGIHRNINEKKVNETRIQEQEIVIHNQAKVAAVGEMLKNISHQWKQPLSIITTIASTIQFKYELKQEIPTEEIITYSQEILSNSNYLAKIINDFSSYFENETQEKENKNLYQTITKIEKLAVCSQNNEISFINDIDKKLYFDLNENLFIQALLNIFNNSCDAFKAIEKQKKLILVKVYKKDDCIKIIIKDNAKGIEEELLDKIFEPYFTTKHQSLGTGIGLFMTTQVITKHLNGNIHAQNNIFDYENKQYKGLCFKIELPLS